MKSPRHIPALDGARGIAILAVFFYHATQRVGDPWQRAASWGWMGVDLFFVLSGFLITGILLDARASRRYYRAFYARRALRILPPFALLMAGLVLAGPILGLTAREVAVVSERQAWYWAFATNVLVASGGWAAVTLQTAPLWSLAVEEQFYLIWPIIVRRLTPARVVQLAFGIIIGAALLRAACVLTHVRREAIYVLTPMRADTLAWGALIAAAVRTGRGSEIVHRFGPAALAAGALGTLGVLAGVGSGEPSAGLMQIVGYSCVGLMSAGTVAMAVTRRSRLLTSRPLRFVGRYSYALYLWHVAAIQAVFRLTAVRGVGLVTSAFGIALMIALLSWVCVERPALRCKRFVPMTETLFAPIEESFTANEPLIGG